MQTIYPDPYSLIDPLLLASMVRDKYGLKKVVCTLITRGVGDTYSITSSGNRFILRVYRPSHRNLRQIEAEVDLLVALKKADISVSYPINNLQGDFIQTITGPEGLRHTVLYSYAPGIVVPDLKKEQLRNLGRKVARFHNVSSNIYLGDSRWNFDVQTTLDNPLELLKPAFANDKENYHWLKQAVDIAKEKLSSKNDPGFTSGYCHFDLLPKNFHFEGDSVTIFDFDFFGYGWLVNDIMTFWVHLCLDVHFGKTTQALADEAYLIFLDAYRTQRALSEQELAAVPYLSLGFWLFYSGFHTTHDEFLVYVQPKHLKPRVDLIKQLMNRYWEKDATALLPD